MIKKTNKKIIHKKCFFCMENIQEIDYKNIGLLRKFISLQGKITATKRNGVCAKHQRKVAQAIKRARQMGLVSYTSL